MTLKSPIELTQVGQWKLDFVKTLETKDREMNKVGRWEGRQVEGPLGHLLDYT